MKQIKKFRKNNWDEDEQVESQRRNPNKKRFDRALRTMDIDFLEDYEDWVIPTYTFRNTESKEEFDIVMKMSELDQYKLDHPELQVVITMVPPLKYNNHGKPDNGFRDVLRGIKKAHPRGNVNTFDWVVL